ncbi:MAG: glycosyltransferase family 2 protein [Thermoleophilia bacterium]|nr:glycosyltransferase family 2 protein [Thermoleophilia bacterium]
MPVSLAVVIPATDDPPTLDRCLAAISAAADPPTEIIVVDEPRSAGPAEARNEGVTETTADVVVFIDSDVVVRPDVFARIRAAFAESEDLVAIFGSYDDLVAPDEIVAGFRNLLHHTVHQRSAGDVRSFWAGLGAVRRAAFDAVGGFDAERYPLSSIEDVELGGRLVERGRIVLDPRLRGTHLKRWTLSSMVRTDFGRRGVPWVVLLVEQRAIPATLNLGARERGSALAALVAFYGLVRRRPVVAAAALLAGAALNHDLITLLHRNLGVRGAIAGVGLHTIHQLTAVAAVPAGLVQARGVMRIGSTPARRR